MVNFEGVDLAMKGFTHTLEAIIGSILLISSVALMSSTLQSSSSVDSFDTSLNEEVSRKIDEISIQEAENEVDTLLPSGYGHSAFIRDTDTEKISLSADGGTDSYYVNKSGDALFLHLFSEGTGYNISYRGVKAVENGSSGYKGFRSSNTSGFLNVSGTVDVTVEAVNQSVVGQPELRQNVDTYNFPMYNRSPAEVKISVWK